MVDYEVSIFTGNRAFAYTFNHVYIKLVGTDGESERERALAFTSEEVSTFTMSCPASIGKLVLIELDKQPLLIFPQDNWFPAKVEVKSPEGDTYNFPIYCWITDSEVHRFREGTALRVFEDKHDLGRYSREQELKQRGKDYCWDVYVEGIPHCMKAEDPCSLPCEILFSFTKAAEFAFTAVTGLIELKLEHVADCKENWTDIDDMKPVLCCKRIAMSSTELNYGFV
ncbi:polyunsaturated fatty acid lipoxygenase ALOX15B-like [Dicentrarchus labrax]|uniref:polyunsaturated fatty acid lipoxygenase ALOX15B-like n=1 Tax=Dicentrarchus labrax TaxID=13489 RepID=UPI0021F5296C|nr:polyunsaturated fatty acid lipoxygenase ALOX15B-like [Dicentrarchus labrax]